MWVQPDVAGIDPGYQQQAIDDDELNGRLATIASGIPGHDAAISIHNRSAALHVARLQPGDVGHAAGRAVSAPVRRPRAGRASSRPSLSEGDAVRLTASNGVHVAAREARRIARLGDARSARRLGWAPTNRSRYV